MLSRLCKTTVLGIALAGTAPSVYGIAPGFYVGGGFGYTKLDASNMDLARRMVEEEPTYDPFPSVDADTDSTGWKVYGGYQFNDYFALEVEYADLGKNSGSYTATYTEPFSSGTESGTFKADADGFGFSGVASVPVADRFSLFAKGGVFRWEGKASSQWSGVDSVSGPFVGTSSGTTDGTDFMFGLGARWYFTERFGARAEWQRFTEVGGFDIDFLSLNVEGRFR